MSSSILTNTSAMAALATLRSINDQLDTTQNRISSGMRVASASDNAAYWSIATTMRSDNQALSAVSDALGLGASTVDVAYTAMNSVVDTLNDVKARLVSAKQPGVDKSKIQSEISSLQQTIKSTAESATFSGSNWLSIDSTDPSSTTQSVVASLSRSSNGAISLGTIDVDTTTTALFDANANGIGILEKDVGNLSTAGIAASQSDGTAATAASSSISGAWTATNNDVNGDGSSADLTFTLDVDGAGAPTTVTVTVGNGQTVGVSDVKDAIDAAGIAGITTSIDPDTHGLVITSDTTGASSAIDLAGFTDADGLGAADFTSGASSAGAAATAAVTTISDFSAVTLDKDDSMSFSLAVDGGQAQTITIDRDLVDKVLGTTDGVIGSESNMADLLTAATAGMGVTVAGSAGSLTLTGGTSGSTLGVTISNVKASNGGNAFNLMDLDITDATSDQLSDYINGIDEMIGNVTTAASDLGAKKTQIDNQSTFLSSLMDSIDTGVGRLVDADMNEESTKLKALQTQQQLGIQALSIANSNSQSILSLFR